MAAGARHALVATVDLTDVLVARLLVGGDVRLDLFDLGQGHPMAHVDEVAVVQAKLAKRKAAQVQGSADDLNVDAEPPKPPVMPV